MKEVVIHVQEHSEEGFEYSIYANREDVEDDNTIDGGFFDGTFLEAVDFAVSEAKEIVSSKTACPACKRMSMRTPIVHNALSRYESGVYVCGECGVREALEGFFWGK